MGAESNSKATPKVVKLNKALKLAEAWVNNMTASTTREPSELEFEGRPSRLGIGAKITPNVRAAASTDPVERKLLSKINASKKSSFKDSSKDNVTERNGSSDDDDESESRTNSFVKKRTLPLVASPQSKKRK